MEIVTGDIININNEYGTYQEYKAAVDAELQRSAESFVRIGYLLKVARDTDILKESGYSSVNEFAQAEYGLDKSQVSRFIRINDEYSEGGYSDRLQEQYQGYGYAKLSLMLLIPAVITEELSSDYSKAEIQTIKEEIDAEMKRTELEVLMEEQDRQQAHMDSILQKAVHQLGHDEPELYAELHKLIQVRNIEQVNTIKELMAPAGEKVYFVRIQGMGKLMVLFRKSGEDIPVTNVRTSEKEIFSWQQVWDALNNIMKPELEADASWQEVYGEPFPVKKTPEKTENTEVAPVQPKKEEKKKPSKVSRAKEHPSGTDRNHKEQEPEDRREGSTDNEPGGSSAPEELEPAGGSDAVESSEEQLPGQMELEKDFSEYCPEKTENTGVAPVQPEMSPHMVKELFRIHMEELNYQLTSVKRTAESRIFDVALQHLEKAGEEIRKLMLLSKVEEDDE